MADLAAKYCWTQAPVSHPWSAKISASPQRMKMVQNGQYWFYGWERKVDELWCVRAHPL